MPFFGTFLKEAIMPIRKLKNFLDEQNIKYVVISHSTAYTAQEVAQSAHISGKELAKTVVIKLNGKLAMAVLPATFQIDFDLLKEATGAKAVELAAEDEFQSKFPDCELGAMPPFGNLYGMDVFVEQGLMADEEIAFNAGNHRELIKLAYKDFAKLVEPKVIAFSSAHVS